MTTLMLFWISVGVVFLIVEMLTSTFYGLSLAISAFVVFVYVLFVPSNGIDLVQVLIFAILSAITAYFLPKKLTPENTEKLQGLDLYIGQIRHLKAVGEDWKISLDGVDYIAMVEDDSEIEVGDKVKVVDRKGSVFYVEKV